MTRRESHWFKRTFDRGIADTIERARQAQEQHDQTHDVQLRLPPLTETDPPSPRSVSASGDTRTRPRDGATNGKESASPLTPEQKLEIISRSVDRIRASLIRCVDAGHAPTLDHTNDLIALLESIGDVARAERLVRLVPEPQSIHADRFPGLRLVT